MFLHAPWLALTAPWAVVAWWVWRRASNERATTASFLWNAADEPLPRLHARRARPPPWVIAALAGLFAIVFAVAEPAYRTRLTRVAVVIDPSIALMAQREGRSLREEMVDRCVAQIARSGVAVAIDAHIAGVGEQLPNLDAARVSRFTAAPTANAIARAIDDEAADYDALIVLTDQPIALQNDHLAVIAPNTPPDNVGIEWAVAVARPRCSLMVRIANDSDRRGAMLEVRQVNAATSIERGPSSSTQPAEILLSQRMIALPTRGEREDFFFDLGTLHTDPDAEIEVALLGLNDAFAIDDTAWLLRESAPPRLVVGVDVPEVASRFASAYGRLEDARFEDGPKIRIERTQKPVTTQNDAEIIFAPTDSRNVVGELRFAAHPVFRDVSLDAAKIERIARTPPDAGAGWLTIASVGTHPILAVLESPLRALWIGFDLDPNDARSVVLLGNALEWLTDGGLLEWRGATPAAIGRDWRAVSLRMPNVAASPGVYSNGAAHKVAVNVPALVRSTGLTRGDVPKILRAADRSTLKSLRQPLANLAAMLMCSAGLLYGGRPRS